MVSDAIAFMKTLASGSVGAVVTDPPFFVGISRDGGGQGADPWSDVAAIDDMLAWSKPLAVETFRVLRPGGAAVVMGGSQSISAWEIEAERAGLCWMAELTVLWNQGKARSRNFGGLTTTIRWHAKPGARHAFNSGDKRAIYSNVIVCDKISIADRVHPAQKPIELTNFLISLLSDENDLIVDPFCGSGSTLVSAAMCDRRFTGCDRDPANVAIACERVRHAEFEDVGEICLWVNGTLYPVETY
jgi:DNA modification methylase